MDNFDAWLAEMPASIPDADLQRKIAEAETRLGILRALEQAKRGHTNGNGPVAQLAPEAQTPAPSSGRIRPEAFQADPRRLSPQRLAIVKVLRDHPRGLAPAQVAERLRAAGEDVAGDNAVQTNMSRMAKLGFLTREAGLYRLPPHIASHPLFSEQQPGGED